MLIKTNSILIKYLNLSTNARNIYCLASNRRNNDRKCKSKLYLNEDLLRFYSTEGKQKSNGFRFNYNKVLLRSGSIFAAIGTVGVIWYNANKYTLTADKLDVEDDLSEFGREIQGLKSYTAEEVAKHNHKSKRIWVSYRSGVYDITDFVYKHPGGDKILMASGGALEPFWTLFAVHKTKEMMTLLEEYRIGNLDLKDRTAQKQESDDPFFNDPIRHPILKPRSEKPFNAEPPEELLVQSFLTPKYEKFFKITNFSKRFPFF